MTKLVILARRGDQDAFSLLFDLTSERVHRRVLRQGLQAADAEDVVVAAFAEAYRSLPRLRESRRFEAWVNVIARRASSELRRRQQYRATIVQEAEDLDQRTAPEEDDDWERSDALNDAFRGISEQDRRLLEAKFLKRLTLDQIAVLTGLKVHQIAYRLKRLREALSRRRLDE